MDRQRIIKGEDAVRKALVAFSEAEQAIVMARIVEKFGDYDAARATKLLGQMAGERATRLGIGAMQDLSQLASSMFDPRPTQILVPVEDFGRVA